MKKIKSIQQLKEEKKSIQQRQSELEDKIHRNWSSLKEAVKPANMAKEAFDKARDKNTSGTSGENILKSTFTYGLTLLAQKLSDKAEEKLNKIFSWKGKK